MSFPYLDLAIGMSFIFLMLALTCSTINETIAGIINSRGKTLAKGIGELLQDTGLTKQLYEHPLISGITGKTGEKPRLPSYINSNKFALALMDILTGPAAVTNVNALMAGVASLPNEDTKKLLTSVLQNPRFKTDQERLEAWYEQGMGRVSGWYKRSTQVRVFVLAAIVTLGMNADAIKMLRALWTNPTLSAVLVEKAKVRLDKGRPDAQPMATYPNPDDPTASVPTEIPARDVVSEEESQLLHQVTSWQGDWYDDWKNHDTRPGILPWLWYLVTNRLGGWIITIFAVSLGAPFWFDLLNKFMNVRNAGKPPEKNATGDSAQKQAAPTDAAPAGAA
jgi:hypothetical protein